MKKRIIAEGIVGLALLGAAAAGIIGWYSERRRVAEMEAQIVGLQKDQKRSVVLRSISKQMEDIAFQQKEISDEQREEALQQKRMADDMRQSAETERQNALEAQQKAVVSEQQAQDARKVAESERLMAEHQRVQAEFSKRVADTLSYIALGRSLGSVAMAEEMAGNSELATLLAYASYLYTARYNGDVYYPAVFQSLLLTSKGMRSYPKHRGAVMCVHDLPAKEEKIMTAGSYGAVMVHRKQGDRLVSETLFNDSKYDFRSAYVNKDGTFFAVVSRSGNLVCFENGSYKVTPLTGLDLPACRLDNPMFVTSLDDNTLLVASNNGLAFYNIKEKKIVASRSLNFRITCWSRCNNLPILFDDKGKQHLVKSMDEISASQNPVSGRVTAFASSKSSKQQVYGMSDGTVYLFNERTSKVTKLVGHLSRISQIKLNGYKLLTSSYDGTVKFWNTASEKIEPTTMVTTNSWIMDFCYDKKKESIWIGDQDGVVTDALLSVPVMVDVLKKKLKRNLTTEEWNYYIGKNVPYESFINGKEAKQ